MPGSASERRDSARTAVVWDGARPDPRAQCRPARARRPRHRRRHRRVRGPGGRARPPGHRRRPQPRRPGRPGPPGPRGRRRRSPVTSRATSADLPTLAGPAGADVVLCHGVLEVVDDPAAALATIREVLRPGGRLSPAGRPAARRGHRPGDGRPLRPGAGPARRRPDGPHRAGAAAASPPTRSPRCSPTPASTSARCTASGSSPTWSPASLLDLEPGATAALLDLERAVADRPEYLPLATQLHLSPPADSARGRAGCPTCSECQSVTLARQVRTARAVGLR